MIKLSEVLNIFFNGKNIEGTIVNGKLVSSDRRNIGKKVLCNNYMYLGKGIITHNSACGMLHVKFKNLTSMWFTLDELMLLDIKQFDYHELNLSSIDNQIALQFKLLREYNEILDKFNSNPIVPGNYVTFKNDLTKEVYPVLHINISDDYSRIQYWIFKGYFKNTKMKNLNWYDSDKLELATLNDTVIAHNVFHPDNEITYNNDPLKDIKKLINETTNKINELSNMNNVSLNKFIIVDGMVQLGIGRIIDFDNTTYTVLFDKGNIKINKDINRIYAVDSFKK